MTVGQVNFSQIGAADQPSPSIWKDCPLDALNKEGEGFFVHADFLNAPLINTTITSALLARLMAAPNLGIDGDDDTVFTRKAAELGGYLDIETDGDDNDACAIFTMPFGKVVLNSGNKLWAEARVEVGALADQGFFFGFGEEAALSRDIVADNGVALIGESLVGFRIRSDDTDDMDFVYKLDAGTEVVVQGDVTNASTITSAGGTAAHLVLDTEVKIGFKFDGKETIFVYVNGYKAASLTVTSAFPIGVNLGLIMCIKTGTGAAQSIAIDWMRGAYEIDR